LVFDFYNIASPDITSLLDAMAKPYIALRLALLM